MTAERASSASDEAAPAPNPDSGARPRLSLEEKTAELKVRRRDCRSCRAFRPDDSGMSFGWCTAFEQYVKLYHPAGDFWSQCQFKVIARTPCPQEPAPADTASEASPSAPRRTWVPVPAAD